MKKRSLKWGYNLYLAIEILFVVIALIFITSISMDIIEKIKLNYQVMNLDNYILSTTEDIKECDSYYKNTIVRDNDSNKDYNVILVSKEMLDLKQFKVNKGTSLSKDESQNIIVGSEVGFNINENINIEQFSISIKGTVVGILDDEEYLWDRTMVVPKSLKNSIVVIDNNYSQEMMPKKYIVTDKEQELLTKYDFVKIKNSIINELFDKESSIYISFLFILVLLIIAINSINIVISIILEDRKKEIGVKYSLGATKKFITNEILSELYRLVAVATILGVIISIIIQMCIPKQLGYTLNLYSIVGGIIILIIILTSITIKINNKIRKYSVSHLIKGR